MARYSSIVTRKGQITIPIEMRRELNIQEGDRVEFIKVDNRVLHVKPVSGESSREARTPQPDSALSRIREIASRYVVDRCPATLDEIQAAAEQGWTERERRITEERDVDEPN